MIFQLDFRIRSQLEVQQVVILVANERRHDHEGRTVVVVRVSGDKLQNAFAQGSIDIRVSGKFVLRLDLERDLQVSASQDTARFKDAQVSSAPDAKPKLGFLARIDLLEITGQVSLRVNAANLLLRVILEKIFLILK